MLLCSSTSICDIDTFDPLVVNTSDGKIRGKYIPNKYDNNMSIRAYHGVPFAQAPIGPLRFKVIKIENISIKQKNSFFYCFQFKN